MIEAKDSALAYLRKALDNPAADFRDGQWENEHDESRFESDPAVMRAVRQP